jgi:hypothetical protein
MPSYFFSFLIIKNNIINLVQQQIDIQFISFEQRKNQLKNKNQEKGLISK